MKKPSREAAPSRKSPVVLKPTALEAIRGGLVSNFNRIGSDENAGGGVIANSGPTGMW